MEPTTHNRACNQPTEARSGILHRCGRETKFFIAGIAADGTRWAEMVCGLHDRSVGRANLRRWHPEMSRNEIVKWDMAIGREE